MQYLQKVVHKAFSKFHVRITLTYPLSNIKYKVLPDQSATKEEK